MRALIIDDSKAMRSILGRMLRGLSFEVVEAGNGREGIERLREAGKVDLALVDWNMPVMNGLEFVVALRRKTEWRRIAIVMVTTENEHSQVVRALAAGAHEYLIKPFDESALLEKLALLGFETPEPTDEPELADQFAGGVRP